MTKSNLARFVRASAVNAKQAGYTMRVYGLDAYSLQSYGSVTKDGHFFKPILNATNPQIVRMIRNGIGAGTYTLEGRKGILHAINHFKKGA